MRTKRMVTMIVAIALTALLQAACSGVDSVLVGQETTQEQPGQPGDQTTPPSGQDGDSGGVGMTQ
jgi:hypothetical protein